MIFLMFLAAPTLPSILACLPWPTDLSCSHSSCSPTSGPPRSLWGRHWWVPSCGCTAVPWLSWGWPWANCPCALGEEVCSFLAHRVMVRIAGRISWASTGSADGKHSTCSISLSPLDPSANRHANLSVWTILGFVLLTSQPQALPPWEISAFAISTSSTSSHLSSLVSIITPICFVSVSLDIRELVGVLGVSMVVARTQ